MSEPKETKPPISIKIDDETEAALKYLLSKTPLRKHAVLVAAVREGLRAFILDQTRLNAAHAKERIPIPESNTEVLTK